MLEDNFHIYKKKKKFETNIYLQYYKYTLFNDKVLRIFLIFNYVHVNGNGNLSNINIY